MKFYILGTNKSNHVIKTSKPLFESYNLDKAINVFEKYINEIRKTKLFLIVDFEKTKKSKFKYLNIDHDYEDTEGGTSVPFFIIGEWSLGLNNDMCIRSDRTQIVMRGFNREFTDNLAAFKYFYSCITKLIPCEFRLLYKQRFYKDGKLYFKHIYADETEISLEMFGEYKWGEEFKISKVSYEDGIRSFKFGDETRNNLWISQDNMYIVDEEQVENIYNEINGLVANSFEGKTVIDPAIDIGDKIIIDGKSVIYQGEMTLEGRFVAQISSKIQIKQKYRYLNFVSYYHPI